jgi:hypothetical protein
VADGWECGVRPLSGDVEAIAISLLDSSEVLVANLTRLVNACSLGDASARETPGDGGMMVDCILWSILRIDVCTRLGNS